MTLLILSRCCVPLKNPLAGVWFILVPLCFYPLNLQAQLSVDSSTSTSTESNANTSTGSNTDSKTKSSTKSSTESSTESSTDTSTETNSDSEGVLTERLDAEREVVENPYLFIAHKQNYFFPISYSSAINSDVYNVVESSIPRFLNSEEVKFQLSLKVQLNEEKLVFKNDGLFVGLTLKAWWQLYSKDISSPFRETNYQPEVFYFVPTDLSLYDGYSSFAFGLEHQSNGQVQGLSRSWNRLYVSWLYERENFFGIVRPWYRLPEKLKSEPLDPKGDDNPDIQNFFGYAEFSAGYRATNFEWLTTAHGNIKTGRGGAEVAVSFPLFKRFRGVVQYFNGYGDSLIDYDHFQQRLSFGVLLSNLF